MTYSVSSRRAIWSCVAAGWLITVILGLLSNGVHHDDDLVHFLMARWSWWYPEYLLNVWGRPGMTIPMAATSWAGDVEVAWHAARVLSATVSAAVALLAALLAARIGIERPCRVALLCYLQPLFTVLGYTTLTENFTALYLIAAVSLFHAGRAALASCIFSLALLTRHEAIAFVPLWWWVIFQSRHSLKYPVASAVLCLWAPAAHNLAYAAIHGSWPITLFFHPSGSTQYRPMAWGAYVPDAVYATTIPILLLAGIGVVYLRRLVGQGDDNKVTSPDASTFLIVAIPSLFLLLHATFKALGVYASGGFARFMVAVAPFTAICAAAGIQVMWGNNATRRRGAALLAVIITLFIWAAAGSEIHAGRHILLVPQFLTQWSGSAQEIVDAASHVLGAILVAAFVWLALMKNPRGIRLARSTVAAILLVLTLVHMAVVVRPLALPGKALDVARAANWIEQKGYAARPLFAADAWFAYFCGLIENPRAFKDIELLSSMPVGTIVAWDSIYSGSDYHGIDDRVLTDDSAYRELWGTPGQNQSGMRIRLFEKIRETPRRVRSNPVYPPRLADRRPPIRGIFYLHDSSRPQLPS